MAEGNGSSDERIGEALIKEVMEVQLKEVPSEDVPPFKGLVQEVKTDQEKKTVEQLAIMTELVGKVVVDNKPFQDAIDGLAKSPGPVTDKFKKLVTMVMASKISWEVIVLLFYVAGKLAVKMVEASLPQCVIDVLRCTLNFFRNTLLSWVTEHGGWINSFSELACGLCLACVSMQRMSSVSNLNVVLIFMAGMILGSIVSYKLTRNS